MVRVLIVEDQKIMQKYFEYIILQNPEFKLVDTVSDAREAVKICNYSAIDLVLMDVQTFHNHEGGTSGYEDTCCNLADRSQSAGAGKNRMCRQPLV